MTQKYYTEKLLPHYIKAINRAVDERPDFNWKLQEDNDPSHGTKTTKNVAYLLKKKHNILSIVHPAQSPDLNPVEGCWLILKERTKRRLYHPKPDEEPWDRTTQHLKKILYQVWESIELKDVQKLIDEMPWRCKMMVEMDGERVRSKAW